MPNPRTPRPTLLVDTYNVLHVTGVLPPELAGPDPAGLARLMARSRYAGRAAWLVCDGAPPGSRRSGGVIRQPAPGVEGVEIVYAGPGRDADSAIERLVARDTAPRRLLVVSSDRRIMKAARKRRCAAMPSEAFLAHLSQDHARPGRSSAYPAFALDVPLDPLEIKRWRDAMNLDGVDLPPARDTHRAREEPPASPPSRTDSPPGEPPKKQPPDPLLEDALREWDGRLDLDDLDMSRWLDGPN